MRARTSLSTPKLTSQGTAKTTPARILSGVALRAATLATAAALISASPASAGQYTVTFNAYANTQPGCSIWTLNGSTAFRYNPPCNSLPLGFDIGGGLGGSASAGARIGMQTNAPAGVAITSTLGSLAAIYNLNNNQGWGGGSRPPVVGVVVLVNKLGAGRSGS
jgi:hypothetical protein